MAKKKIDWGVPDWRKAGDYPNPENMTDDRWRWEFLRRRDDYRQTWERAKRIPQGLRHIRRGMDGQLILDPRRDAFSLEPPPKKAHRKKAPAGYFDLKQVRLWQPDVVAKPGPPLPPQKWTFDPNRPRWELIDAFTAHVDFLHRKIRASGKRIAGEKPQRDKWPLYLRVLDAHEDAEEKLLTIAVELLGCHAPDRNTLGVAEYDRQLKRAEQAEARAKMLYDQACTIRDLLP